MNSKATLYLSLFALTMKLSSSFSPSPVGAALTVKSFIPPFPSTSHRHVTTSSSTTTCTSTKLMLVPEVTEAVAVVSSPGSDDKIRLAVGFIILACAETPYALAIPFPSFFNTIMFLPTYRDDELGRLAEIAWKVRYATLGLALTALSFFEVMSGESDPSQILKDSYILWAIFYTDAALKVNKIQYIFVSFAVHDVSFFPVLFSFLCSGFVLCICLVKNQSKTQLNLQLPPLFFSSLNQ